MAKGELRFGVGHEGGSGGRYWNLRSAATRPELYLRHVRLGAFFGFSLHEHPDYWQAKVVRRLGADPEYVKFPRPEEFHPGYTKAIVVLMHAGLAERGTPATKTSVVWHEAARPEHIVHFTLFIERPGANLDTWPGKRASGTAFIGRLTMADGSTAVVVAHETLAQEVTYKVPSTEAQRDEMRASVRGIIDRGGDPWVMTWGTQDDGTVVVIEGPVEPDRP